MPDVDETVQGSTFIFGTHPELAEYSDEGTIHETWAPT